MFAYGEEQSVTIQGIDENLDYAPGQLIDKYKPEIKTMQSIQSMVYEAEEMVLDSSTSVPQLSQVSESEDIFQGIDENLDYVPGQLILKYKPGIRMMQSVQSMVYETPVVVLDSSGSGTQLLQVSETEDVFQIIEELEDNPFVEYAEPNYIVRAFDIDYEYEDKFIFNEDLFLVNSFEEPNDTYFSEQYGLKMVNAPQAWSSIDTDNTVTIAVIDTGVDYNHPDLDGKVLQGHNFIEKNSYGTLYGSDPYDDHGHGTHVAGIIAGITNNKLGIAGVAGPGNVKILPVKMLNDAGRGTSYDLAQAIRYAGDQGAKIINLSLGSSFPSSVERDAIAYVQDLGCLVIAAAGNESSRVEYTYPASYPGVISVAAVDKNEKPAWFSNYGPTLDISAPGVDILSTLPAGVADLYKSRGDNVIGNRFDGYYVSWSGTSMATPHVVGVAALYKLAHPDASPLEITEMLISTAKDIEEIGHDITTGHGLVDAAAILGQEPIRRTLAFLAPRNNSNVYGTTTISFQTGIPQETEVVDFYLDEINEANKLKSIQCSPNKNRYSWEWDTREKTDGEYTILGVARNSSGEALGDAVAIEIRIKNEITSGLALEIKTPDNEVAKQARAYVFTRENDGKYRLLGNYYANDAGHIRTLDFSGSHENGYEVFILGKMERDTEEPQLFLYHRHFEGPGSYTIDGTNAVKTSVLMQGEFENLNNPLFSIVPLGNLQKQIGVIGPIEGGKVNTIYLDKGEYDFYGFWNPTRDKEAEQEKATYLLMQNQVINDETTELKLTTNNAGKILALPQADQDTILYLKNDKAEQIWGIPFVEHSLTGSELIVTAGDYKAKAQVERADKEGVWTYYFDKTEVVSISPHSPVEISFGGSLQISHFEPLGGFSLNKGDTLRTENKFTDNLGNILTGLYGPSPYSFISNYSLFMMTEDEAGEFKVTAFDQEEPEVGFQEVEIDSGKYMYPTFRIYDSKQNEVYSYSTWSYYTESRWNSGRDYTGEMPPQPGSYKAELILKAGPLVEGGILQKSFDLELVAPDGKETLDVVIKDRDGVTPVPGAKVDIYSWQEATENQSGSWERIQGLTADKNGVVHLGRNLNLNQEGNNFVVVWTARSATAKSFANINELNRLDFTNTGKVDLRIYDKFGNRQIEKVRVPIYHQGEVVTEVTLQIDRYNSEIYLDYGVHPYIYSMFNQGISTYIIGKKNFEVVKDPYDLPITLELGGPSIAQVGVVANEGLSLPIMKFKLADASISLPEIDTEYTKQVYITPDRYQIEVIAKDKNTEHTYYFTPNGEEIVALEAGNNYQWQFGKAKSIALNLNKSKLKSKEKLKAQVLIQDEHGNRINQVTQGDSVINPTLKIYKVDEEGVETLVQENSDSKYYKDLMVDLPDNIGTYRVELILGIDSNTKLITPPLAEYNFSIIDDSLKRKYQLKPYVSPLYENGVTLDGVQMMTLNRGVTGNTEFVVDVKSVKEHIGEETIIFVHLRNGIQIGLNRVKDDFDQKSIAKTTFTVREGDIVKVYMVDDLNARLDINPLVLH